MSDTCSRDKGKHAAPLKEQPVPLLIVVPRSECGLRVILSHLSGQAGKSDFCVNSPGS